MEFTCECGCSGPWWQDLLGFAIVGLAIAGPILAIWFVARAGPNRDVLRIRR